MWLLLKQLLAAINDAGYVSKPALAAELGRPLVLVEEGFAALVRMGYLAEDAGAGCVDLPCGKCPYASMCQKEPVQMWKITDKGRDLLANMQRAG